jgi:exodeoxyribonuclease V alpha subunit
LLVTRGPLAGRVVLYSAPARLLPFLRLRLLVRLRGEWARGGRVFAVAGVDGAAREAAPDDAAALGVEPAAVAAALDAAGAASLAELARMARIDPAGMRARLEAVPNGWGGAVLAAAQALAEDAEVAECALLFERVPRVGYDLPRIARVASALERRAARLGKTVAELLREDPWALAQAIPDEPTALRDAEILAEALGRGGGAAAAAGRVAHLALREARNGHAFVPRDAAFAAACKAAGKEAAQAVFAAFAGGGSTPSGARLVADSKLRERAEAEGAEWQAVYPAAAFFSELRAARDLAARLLAGPGRPLDAAALRAGMERWAGRNGVELGPDQLALADAVASGGLALLAGEAGAGKTTALVALIRALLEMGLAVDVLAPTGLAAQRLAARAGLEPHTVHRYARIWMDDADLLDERGAETGEPGPAEPEPDVLVVDEMSMQTVVMQHRMQVAAPRARLVLAGDPFQLPPVGPGGVFPALLELAGEGRLPGASLVRLEGARRHGGGLLENARRVRRGLEIDPSLGGVEVVEVPSAEEAVEAAARIAADLRAAGAGPMDVLVLAPTRGRAAGEAAGATQLNRRLAEALSRGEILVEPFGDFPAWRAGDPVVAIRNDYEGPTRPPAGFRRGVWERLRGLRPPRPTVFNGTRGVLVGRAPGVLVEVRWLVPAPGGGLREVPALYHPLELPAYIELAYAMTVHKAQGGEAEHVVLVFTRARHKRRALLYTALTRCKGGRAVLVATPEFLRAEYAGNGAASAEPGDDELPPERVRSKFKWRVLAEVERIWLSRRSTLGLEW